MSIRDKVAQHRADTNDGVTQICPGWSYYTDPLVRAGASLINGVIWRKPARWDDHFPQRTHSSKLNSYIDMATGAGKSWAQPTVSKFEPLRVMGHQNEAAAQHGSHGADMRWKTIETE